MSNLTEEVVDGFVMSLSVFDWSDYFVFSLMILMSILIGVYFGCCGKKMSTEEYLLGGKSMTAWPVGLSLVASHISGITLIGTPAEVYTSGSTYWFLCLSMILVGISVKYFFIPVIWDLNITNVYEYLELRFDRRTRSYGSGLYVIGQIVFLPCVIYVPCLALAQVTGINLHIISVAMTVVCMFYTMLGGLKAVVWTDFLQTIVTLLACIAVIIIGTNRVGGVSYIWKIAKDNGKLDLNFDFDPFQKNTFWSVFIGLYIAWFCGSMSSQVFVQRIIAVRNRNDTTLVMIIFCGGVALLTTMSVYAGLLSYAAYFGCDPIERHIVSKVDQIYPFFVLDKVGHVPILPGLFMAGIFSAALSSLSTGFNTLAGVIYQDVFKFQKKSDASANLILKAIIVVMGIVFTLAIILIEKLKAILSLTYMIASMTAAPLGALFFLGIFVPYINAKGAFFGSATSLLFLVWIVVGSNLTSIHQPHQRIYPNTESTCPKFDALHNFTFTDDSENTLHFVDNRFILYKLPFTYYVTFGATVASLVSFIVTYFTGGNDLSKMDPNVITPPLRFLLKKSEIEEGVEMKLTHNAEDR